MTALEARERDHDLLSFMSLIIRTHKTLDTALTLLSIAIDDASIDIEVRSEKGGYFAVYLAPSKQLLAARFWRLDADALLENRTLPALVAVKIPQPNGNRDRDRKLWSSMAMELQILRNEYLRNHPNIVALFGVCWKTFRDGTLMPSFVLEAAECDLEKFLSGGDQVDRRTLFGLSEDIISGIRALHHVGIIHGDIKPTNVLIFKDSQVTFTAKIADFGSSLLLSDIRRRMRVSTGTGFWQAPEVRDLLHGLQLMQADVYSLGLVLWRLLGGDVMYDVLDAAAKAAGTTRESYFENLKSTDQSRIPELALQTLTSLSRPRAAKEWSQGNGHGSAKTSASNDGTQSIDAMAKNIATTVSLALARPRDRLRVDQILLNVQQAVDQHLGRGQGEGHLKFGRNVEEQKSDPQDAVSIRNGGAVLEADCSLATLRSLPPAIISNIMRVVKAVATDTEEEPERRTTAAWQYGLFQLRTLQLDAKSEPVVNEALEFILRAADGGHACAQGIVGHLYAAFDREFPRSRDVELGWLRNGVCHGSSTAKRRLQSLSPELYAESMSQLRTRYGGLGIEVPAQYYDHRSWPDKLFLADVRIRRQIRGQVLILCATANRLELLRSMIAEDLVDVNSASRWGESALLCACAGGHRDVVLHLLDCGADPTIASAQGTTPLHFLSSFDDKHIPEICKRLLKARANIEARSKGGHRYRRLFDSTYGDADGTPLTWAVAANNKAATAELLAHRADPFDLEGLNLPYSNTFGGMTHVSPIAYAAQRHQYQLLELMLQSVDRSKVTHFLNTYRRGMGSTNAMAEHDLPIIGWCATYGGDGIGMRLLLHGREHQHAFQRTFEILLAHGADPSGILGAAIHRGQPFVIDYLLGARQVLTPSPPHWLGAIVDAGRRQDWVMFDTLLRYSQADSIPSEGWKEYHASIRDLPDNVRYLNPFRQYRNPTEDYYVHCANALLAGKFRLARWFYETGPCDLSRPITTDEDKTLLGVLLTNSKSYSNALVQLNQLMKLEDLPDSLFWDVLQIGNSKFTALQHAAYYPEYRSNSTMAKTTLNMVTKRWHEPEHINAQITDGPFKGRTALHIAALTANVGAVRCLLKEEEETIDLTLLDCNNCSILDTAAWGLVSQEDRIKEWGHLPSRLHKAVNQDHWERVLEILQLLLKAGAKPRKFAMAVTRIADDKIHIADLQAPWLFTIPFRFFGEKLPAMLREIRFWVEVSKLKKGTSLFVAILDNLSDEETKAGAMFRVASFY